MPLGALQLPLASASLLPTLLCASLGTSSSSSKSLSLWVSLVSVFFSPFLYLHVPVSCLSLSLSCSVLCFLHSVSVSPVSLCLCLCFWLCTSDSLTLFLVLPPTLCLKSAPLPRLHGCPHPCGGETHLSPPAAALWAQRVGRRSTLPLRCPPPLQGHSELHADSLDPGNIYRCPTRRADFNSSWHPGAPREVGADSDRCCCR